MKEKANSTVRQGVVVPNRQKVKRAAKDHHRCLPRIQGLEGNPKQVTLHLVQPVARIWGNSNLRCSDRSVGRVIACNTPVYNTYFGAVYFTFKRHCINMRLSAYSLRDVSQHKTLLILSCLLFFSTKEVGLNRRF